MRDAWIILIAKSFRVQRIVNHLHGADFDTFRESLSPLGQRALDFVYSFVTDSIVLAERMTPVYGRYPKMHTHVVPNCAEAGGTSRKAPHVGPLRVLYLSNIMASKGIIELLVACKTLARQGVPLKLRIAGAFLGDEGASAVAIKRRFFEEFDAAFMEYCGVVAGIQKKELLEWAEVMCLPTYYRTEAQPISLIEGLASGCYLVATAQGHIDSILKYARGAYVQERDCKSIEDALFHVMHNREILEEAEHVNRAVARSEFSLDNYTRRVKEILNDDAVACRAGGSFCGEN